MTDMLYNVQPKDLKMTWGYQLVNRVFHAMEVRASSAQHARIGQVCLVAEGPLEDFEDFEDGNISRRI